MTPATDGSKSASKAAIWAGVDRLVDSTSDLSALYAHRIHLLAARRWRELGKPIPPELIESERLSVLIALVTPELLTRVREASDGPLILLKGPELAARYPDPALRPYADLDLLVPDAEIVQRALLKAGFSETSEFRPRAGDMHHLCPVYVPGLPLVVEIHRHLNSPLGLRPPSVADCLGSVVPATFGVDGVYVPAPLQHALIVALNLWTYSSDSPMQRLRDLLDVAVMVDELDRDELLRLARDWKMERLWRTTMASADALFLGGKAPMVLRTWARHLPAVRERTVLELHNARWVAGFSALSPMRAIGVMAGEIGRDLHPEGSEGWNEKLRRTTLAVRDAFARSSTHARRIRRGQHRDDRIARR